MPVIRTIRFRPNNDLEHHIVLVITILRGGNSRGFYISPWLAAAFGLKGGSLNARQRGDAVLDHAVGKMYLVHSLHRERTERSGSAKCSRTGPVQRMAVRERAYEIWGTG